MCLDWSNDKSWLWVYEPKETTDNTKDTESNELIAEEKPKCMIDISIFQDINT